MKSRGPRSRLSGYGPVHRQSVLVKPYNNANAQIGKVLNPKQSPFVKTAKPFFTRFRYYSCSFNLALDKHLRLPSITVLKLIVTVAASYKPLTAARIEPVKSISCHRCDVYFLASSTIDLTGGAACARFHENKPLSIILSILSQFSS